MEKIMLYHQLFCMSFAATLLFLGISIIIFVRLRIWEVVGTLKRNRKNVKREAVRFCLEREIMLIHTNEIIE